MIRFILVLAGSLTFFFSHSQTKADYQWPMGYPGLDGSSQGQLLDFSEDIFKVKLRPRGVGFGGDMNSVVCDMNGDVIYSTNGCAVSDRFGNIVVDSLAYDSTFWAFWYRDIPNACEYIGIGGFQHVLFLPFDDVYYCFVQQKALDPITLDHDHRRLMYTAIDGDGVVLAKDGIVLDTAINHSYLTAMAKPESQGWWVYTLLRESSTVTRISLDSSGIVLDGYQDIGYLSNERFSSGGVARFSPDGKQFVIYDTEFGVQLYDYDRETGRFSNHRVIPVPLHPDYFWGQAEWSASGRFLYTTDLKYLHQIDMRADDPAESITLIDEFDGTQDPFNNNITTLQLGPDCRIYSGSGNGNNSLHVIMEPDLPGTSCDFRQSYLAMPGQTSGAVFPNVPRYRVDDDEPCDDDILFTSIIEQMYIRHDLTTYPNPASDNLHIDLPEQERGGDLRVYDLQGQIVYERTSLWAEQHTVSVGNLRAGTYMVEYLPGDQGSRRIYVSTMVVL